MAAGDEAAQSSADKRNAWSPSALRQPMAHVPARRLDRAFLGRGVVDARASRSRAHGHHTGRRGIGRGRCARVGRGMLRATPEASLTWSGIRLRYSALLRWGYLFDGVHCPHHHLSLPYPSIQAARGDKLLRISVLNVEPMPEFRSLCGAKLGPKP